MYFSIVKGKTSQQTELYLRTDSDVPNYRSLSDEHKLQMVLNFRPLWKKANENEACETIYTFVKNTYLNVQGMTFHTSVT